MSTMLKFELSEAPYTDPKTYLCDVEQGIRVPSLEVDGWECRWSRPWGHQPAPGFGVHLWTRQGMDPEIMVSNAAWAPGLRSVGPIKMRSCSAEGYLANRIRLPDWGTIFPPRFHWGERDRITEENVPPGFERFGQGFAGVMDIDEAGETGGGRLWLHPEAAPELSRIAAGAMAERNPIAAFHAISGEPLTRATLGYGFEYQLDRGAVGALVEGSLQQIPQFALRYFIDYQLEGRLAETEPIDCYHMGRAIADDLGICRKAKGRFPISRTRIIMAAFDVMNAMPLDLRVPGVYNLGRILMNVRAAPHQANIGVVRRWAWVLFVVAAAREVYGRPHRQMDEWLRKCLETLDLAQALSGPWANHGVDDNLDQSEPFIAGTVKPNEREAPIWHSNLLIRAIYNAAILVGEEERAARMVTRYIEMMKRVARVPGQRWDDTQPWGPAGMPLYLIVSRDGKFLDVPEGAWPWSRSEGEPDVWAVAKRLGVVDEIPAHYVRGGHPTFMADVWKLTRHHPAV